MIATYVDHARAQPVAPAARQAALKCVLDLLGAAAAGTADPGATAVRRTAMADLAPGSAPIWFTGMSSSTTGAAWANSAAAAALDLDDGHRLARGHPGAAVIPAAIAVAHDTGNNFEQVLNAIVIGYEVGVTIAAARNTYGTTGTWSPYAVVAAASALRGTPVDVIAHALAIAGESAPNQLFYSAPAHTPAPEGSDVKEGIPWSVVTGMSALALAEAGQTGPRNVLDSPLQYHFPDDVPPRAAQHICATYHKLYACCRHIHAPLDALLQLVSRHSLAPGTIDAIEVDTYSAALRIPNKPEPAHLVDVQYSIPYCLGLALHPGSQALLPLTPEALNNRAAVEIARRTTLTLDPRLDDRFPNETLTRVTVHVGHDRFVSDVTTPQGDAAAPLALGAIREKFKAATRLVATAQQQNQVLDAFDEADVGHSTALMGVLGGLIFKPRGVTR